MVYCFSVFFLKLGASFFNIVDTNKQINVGVTEDISFDSVSKEKAKTKNKNTQKKNKEHQAIVVFGQNTLV